MLTTVRATGRILPLGFGRQALLDEGAVGDGLHLVDTVDGMVSPSGGPVAVLAETQRLALGYPRSVHLGRNAEVGRDALLICRGGHLGPVDEEGARERDLVYWLFGLASVVGTHLELSCRDEHHPIGEDGVLADTAHLLHPIHAQQHAAVRLVDEEFLTDEVLGQRHEIHALGRRVSRIHLRKRIEDFRQFVTRGLFAGLSRDAPELLRTCLHLRLARLGALADLVSVCEGFDGTGLSCVAERLGDGV